MRGRKKHKFAAQLARDWGPRFTNKYIWAAGLMVLMFLAMGFLTAAGKKEHEEQKDTGKVRETAVLIQPLQETSRRDAEGNALYQAEEVEIRLTAVSEEGIHAIRWELETDEKKEHLLELPVYVLPEPEPEPTPVTTPDPASTPQITQVPEETPEPQTVSTSESALTPTSESVPESTSAPTSEPTAESTSAPTSEPTAEPTSAPTPAPTAEPTPTSTPAPQGEAPPEPGDTISGWTVQKVDGVLVTEMTRIVRVRKEMNGIVIRMQMTDRKGNSTKKEVYRFSIDRTAPEVRVHFRENHPVNGIFFNESRTAEITVRDQNFDPEQVSFEAVRDGVSESFGNVAWESGKSAEIHKAVIRFYEEGVYDFTVRAADRAGLVSEGPEYSQETVVPQHFVVDRTAPEIRVSYDNNNAKNNLYFSAPRTAHVTITERNFDAGNVWISTGAANVTPLWKSDGYVHTAEIPFSDDGSYVLSVQAADRAGNMSDRFSAGGAAAPGRFVIDRVIDRLKITGVKDGVYYRGDINLKIAAVDQNYASCSVRLFCTRMDEKERDVTAEVFGSIKETKQGWTGSGRIRAAAPDRDGLYELRVILRDLAGNEKTENVSFVVNRHGSVYQYDSRLKALQGTCVKQISQPLVITEYNPGPLQGEGKIEVTRDGRPLKEIQAEIQSGRLKKGKTAGAGWYQYRYLLRPETFLQEGTYRIGITGRDKAGNLLATGRDPEGQIVFSVDRTAPVLDQFYIERILTDGKAVLYMEIFDAIGLARVNIRQGQEVLLERDSFPDIFRLQTELSVSLTEKDPLRIVMRDRAGNIGIEQVRPEEFLTDRDTSVMEEVQAEAGQGSSPEQPEEVTEADRISDTGSAGIGRTAADTGGNPVTGSHSNADGKRTEQAAADRRMDFRYGWLCILVSVTIFAFRVLIKRHSISP